MAAPHLPKPRWERRKDARPQELLAAALRLFVERGYASTRLEDVARLAGVSKGTLYLYFDSKEALFKAVVRENVLPELDQAESAISQYQGHSADLFRALIENWWQRIGDTPLSGISKLIMAEAGNFPELASFYHDEVITRSDAVITSILQRGMARGEFRRIDAGQMTNVIVAPVIMLMLWKHSFGTCRNTPISAPAYLESFIDLCLHGLKLEPQPELQPKAQLEPDPQAGHASRSATE